MTRSPIRRLDMSSLRPACEIASNFAVEVKALPVHRRDVGSHGGNRNAKVPLDQVLAERGGVRRAAASAGDDDLRRSSLQCRNKLRDRLRQALRLPPQNIGRLPALRRHL